MLRRSMFDAVVTVRVWVSGLLLCLIFCSYCVCAMLDLCDRARRSSFKFCVIFLLPPSTLQQLANDDIVTRDQLIPIPESSYGP